MQPPAAYFPAPLSFTPTMRAVMQNHTGPRGIAAHTAAQAATQSMQTSLKRAKKTPHGGGVWLGDVAGHAVGGQPFMLITAAGSRRFRVGHWSRIPGESN